MKFLLAFILILSSSLSEAQSLKKLIEIGDQYNEDGDYYGASLEYAKAVAIDSIDIHLLFKYAESLRKYNNHELAA
ncbi:hypothetical protein N9M27_05975, partial [Flavobacteriales bacterium]|nr:hypothetical protein [Flavobacteriales bacterium]